VSIPEEDEGRGCPNPGIMDHPIIESNPANRLRIKLLSKAGTSNQTIDLSKKGGFVTN